MSFGIITKMLEKLKAWKGIFSKKGQYIDFVEGHAFINGVYYGILPHRGIPKKVDNDVTAHDIQKEPHYARAGYILGETGKYIAIVVATMMGIPLL